MNFFCILSSACLVMVICLASLAQAGGDKSARTTVITLAGGGDKAQGGYPIPIPVPVCTNGHGRGYGGGHGMHHHGYGGGAQARMGWRR